MAYPLQGEMVRLLQARVPPQLGRSRGKNLVIKLTLAGIWIKPKGLRWSGAESHFVDWQTLYSFLADAAARELMKARKRR